jgi:hypothetical protein
MGKIIADMVRPIPTMGTWAHTTGLHHEVKYATELENCVGIVHPLQV